MQYLINKYTPEAFEIFEYELVLLEAYTVVYTYLFSLF